MALNQHARGLPDELIILITDLVACQKDLAALSLSSKRFHSIVEPHLYSTFFQLGENSATIPRFLRTLSQKPHLGRYVKHFVGFSESGITRMDVGVLNEREMGYITANICWATAAASIDAGEWIMQLKEGGYDAMLALLLCLLPNLEDIRMLQYAKPDGHPYTEWVLDRAATLQKSFRPTISDSHRPGFQSYSEEPSALFKLYTSQSPYSQDGQYLADHFGLFNLRKVSLEDHYYDFPQYGIEVLSILPYLALDSVIDVQTHMIRDLRFNSTMAHRDGSSAPTIYPNPLPQFDFKTSSFSVRHSTIEPEALRSLLSLFTALKRFEYRFEYDFEIAEEMMWHPEFTPRSVSDSLAHLSETLEELVITQDMCRPFVVRLSEDQPIGTLSTFKRLRKLEASANVLLGRHVSLRGPPEDEWKSTHYSLQQHQDFTKVFPSSLEHLIIKHCNIAIYSAVLHLLKADVVENLRKIELVFNHDCAVQTFFRGATLEQLARKRGIHITQTQSDCIGCSSCPEICDIIYENGIPKVE